MVKARVAHERSRAKLAVREDDTFLAKSPLTAARATLPGAVEPAAMSSPPAAAPPWASSNLQRLTVLLRRRSPRFCRSRTSP